MTGMAFPGSGTRAGIGVPATISPSGSDRARTPVPTWAGSPLCSA
jgi:hypothetical protein